MTHNQVFCFFLKERKEGKKRKTKRSQASDENTPPAKVKSGKNQMRKIAASARDESSDDDDNLDAFLNNQRSQSTQESMSTQETEEPGTSQPTPVRKKRISAPQPESSDSDDNRLVINRQNSDYEEEDDEILSQPAGGNKRAAIASDSEAGSDREVNRSVRVSQETQHFFTFANCSFPMVRRFSPDIGDCFAISIIDVAFFRINSFRFFYLAVSSVLLGLQKSMSTQIPLETTF